MRIISLIQDPDVIRQILKHLGLWKQDAGSRCKKPKPDHWPVVYEEFDDLSACGHAQAGAQNMRNLTPPGAETFIFPSFLRHIENCLTCSFQQC
jgi:hypothetical protein